MYIPEKPERQTILYRASDQLKHLAGTDRNRLQAQSTQ